jgi:hypothetical protein
MLGLHRFVRRDNGELAIEMAVLRHEMWVLRREVERPALVGAENLIRVPDLGLLR